MPGLVGCCSARAGHGRRWLAAVLAGRRAVSGQAARSPRAISALGCSVVGVEAHELQEAWFRRALDSAGIKRGNWHPGRGVEENRRTVEAVYGYYGRLFIEHPYLQWAGLAGMIGPAFYAGFQDLGLLPDALRGAVIEPACPSAAIVRANCCMR